LSETPGSLSHATARARLSRCRRVVVKIGSKAIARGTHLTPSVFAQLACDLHAVMDMKNGKARRSVVLVSSGAIALGVEHLGMRSRPKHIPGLQAAAAAGQGLLMHRYAEAFATVGVRVAQVLLTHADLQSRTRANNARAALEKLLELSVVPIINENDAVAVDEIKFGDNDELAAMVAPLCDADAVLLLSDVPGLLDDAGERVPYVPRVDAGVLGLATTRTSDVGRGGMKSKLEAARRATLGGAHAIIAPAGEPGVVERVLAGDDVGTLFPARQARLRGRKHWIAFSLRPRGAAVVDAGAASAILSGRHSILCVGVLGIRGEFAPGDPIAIVTADGAEIARGLSKLSAAQAARLARGREDDGDNILVHRDDLVVLPRD
jgi:glutamate 5-kinase